MRTFQIEISEDTMSAINFCYFTLNYLAAQSGQMDDIADGFEAVLETACRRMDDIMLTVYGNGLPD
jgi:hypothetical protein